MATGAREATDRAIQQGFLSIRHLAEALILVVQGNFYFGAMCDEHDRVRQHAVDDYYSC